MAVSLVGTGTFIKSTINGTATTLTFSTGAAASGDVVIAAWMHTRGSLVATLNSSAGTAYTSLGQTVSGNQSILVAYRALTSSETTVTSCATGSALDSVILAAIVLRGGSSTPTLNFESTIGASSTPNSPAVTLVNNNSAVIVIAGMYTNTAGGITQPSGYLNLVSTLASDTRQSQGGLAWLSTNAGLVDPSTWTFPSNKDWVAWTVSLESTEAPAFTWYQLSNLETLPRQRFEVVSY